MILRPAQRAGISGLQRSAVLLQALDEALLVKQGLLVGHLFLESLVLRTQVIALRQLLLNAGINGAQRLRIALLLHVQGLAQCGMFLQLLPVMQLALCVLPVAAQLRQAAVRGQLLLQGLLCGLLLLQRLGDLPCRLRGLLRLCVCLLLQLPGELLQLRHLAFCLDGLPLQLLALLQLLAPAAEVFTQQGVAGMGLLPCRQVGLPGLCRLQLQP